MRIVIDGRTISDHFPGIGRYTFNLVRALAKEMGSDELVLLSNPGLANSRFDLRAFGAGANARIVNTVARPFTMGEQLHLPGELRKLMPAATHFPYHVLPYLAQRPIVVTIYDIIPIRLPEYFSMRHRMLYRISLSLALRAASQVICLSNATLSDLTSEFRTDTSRFRIIPAGVDESFRPCANEEIVKLRTTYGLSEPFILYVGSNKPHKNLLALIDAYARLHEAPMLVIAGEEDPRYIEARRRTNALGIANRVRQLGAVPEKDLPALYSAAAMLVFPSKYEGFGFPPLEAMSCGAPVACSDIPSLRETVGDAALLFNPGDPEDIAASIERILSDGNLRAELCDRGLRRAAELSWSQAARQTLEIYHRAADR